LLRWSCVAGAGVLPLVFRWNGRQAKVRCAPFLAFEIAMYHHERWDGQGYPGGLSGNGVYLLPQE